MTGTPPPLFEAAFEGVLPREIEMRLGRQAAAPDLGAVGGAVDSLLTGGGNTAAMGKGLVDATLGLVRGAAWLGSFGQFDTSKLPQSTYDILPEGMANNLASRIARANIMGAEKVLGADVGEAGEVAGHVLSIVGGGPATAAGKGAGLVSKGASAFTLPGKAIRAFGYPGQAIGRSIAKMPKVAEWTRTAQAIPRILEGASGFGLYNFMVQDGDVEDRVGSALHGALAGGALAVLGRFADAAENKILDSTLSFGKAKKLGELGVKARQGTLPGGLEKALQAMDAAGARAVGTAIEAAGWSMLDREFIDAALSGDWDTAVERYVTTVPAALLARTGRIDAWARFRREMPELNTMDMRRQIMDVRRGRQQQPHEPQPQGPDAPIQGVDRSVQPQGEALDVVTRPLFQSGWELAPGVPKGNAVQVVWPGGGRVSIVEAEGGYQMEVSPEVFKMVRGDDAKGSVRMEGEVAEEFARDLAAVSMMRRMGGEVLFGNNGEMWAGGPWRAGDGEMVAMGLDGQPYVQQLGAPEGADWTPIPLPEITASRPPQDPRMASWVSFAAAVQGNAMRNPGADLMEAAVLTATQGSPSSPSVQHLQSVLQQIDPEALAQQLTPENLESLGMILGRVGSGHQTAESALAEIQEAMAAKPEAEVAEPAAGDREGEAGFLDVGAIASGLESAVSGGARAIGRKMDYFYETTAEAIRKQGPEDPLSFEGRRALSNKRTMRGEAWSKSQPAQEAAKKLGREWRRQTRPGKGAKDGQPHGLYATWERLADKRRKPADETEAMFQDSYQETLLSLWREMRRSGGVRMTEEGWQPLPFKKVGTTPRFSGEDRGKVMGSSGLRKEWFDVLERENPGKVTAEGLEAEYEKSSGVEVSDPDMPSVLEKIRKLPNVPHFLVSKDGHRYEMRASDPRDVLDRLIEQQSSDVAVNKQWGPDVPPEGRKQLEEWIAENPGKQAEAIQEALNRGGIKQRLERFNESVKRTMDAPEDRKRAMEKTASAWMGLIQGRGEDVPRLARMFRSVESVPRSFMTIKAPIYDIPEMVTLPMAYGGLRETLATLKRILTHKGKSPDGETLLEYYKRLGSISQRMGHLMFEESHGLPAKIVDWFGRPGVFTEEHKAVVMSVLADVKLERWADGGATSLDALILSEMRMDPAVSERLLNGKASKEDADQFRNEFVQHTTSRSDRGEGSRSADSWVMNLLMRFQRFITRRITNMQRGIAQVKDAWKAGRSGLPELGRLGSVMGGYLASSVIGYGIMGTLLTALLRGEPEEGPERVARGIVTAEWWTRMGLRAWTGGAPFDTAAGLAGGSRQDLMSTTAAGDVANAVYEFGNSVARDGVGIWNAIELLRQLHFVPLDADVRRAVPRISEQAVAALSGQALSYRTDYILDRDLAYEFLSGPGKERGVMGLEKARGDFEPSKGQDFYDSVKSAMKEFMRGLPNGGFEEGMRRARGHLEEAIKADESSPRSVASWVRSQRTQSLIPSDKMDDFIDFVGPDRAAEIVDRDAVLEDFAREIGRMDGLPEDAWDERLASLRKITATGSSAGVKTAVDQLVDEITREAMESSDPDTLVGDSPLLREMANIIASNPEALRNVMPGIKAYESEGDVSPSDRLLYARRSLYRRVVERYRRRSEGRKE